MTAAVPRPRIFLAIVPSLQRRIFSAEASRDLAALGDVQVHAAPIDLTSAELAKRIGEFDAVITGWGTPAFDEAVVDAARGKLRVIAHSAGSIRHLLPPGVFEAGIAVTHAAAAIAPAVAEMSLAFTLMLLRRIPHYMQSMRSGDGWTSSTAIAPGPELAGTRIGVIGAGHTGRCFIRLLRALEARVVVYDPYLSAAQADDLGVARENLEALLSSCPIVSLQAPSTEATRHMIGRRQLALMQDGAGLINTARSWLVDPDALLQELGTGRLFAALDVFDEEPLPLDSPLRTLPNVLLTPHITGASAQTAARQGHLVIEELSRFFSGKPLRHQVTLPMLQTMA